MNTRQLSLALILLILPGCGESGSDRTTPSTAAESGGTSTDTSSGGDGGDSGTTSTGEATSQGPGEDETTDSDGADAGTEDGDTAAEDECPFFEDRCATVSDSPAFDCGEPNACDPVTVYVGKAGPSSIADRAAADCVLEALRDDTPGFYEIFFVFDDASELNVFLQTMGTESVITRTEDPFGECLDVLETWEPLRSVSFFEACLAMTDAELADSACFAEPGDVSACTPLQQELTCR